MEKSMIMTPHSEERLAAVNGIVVASKVGPGQQLIKKPFYKVGPRSKYKCAICKGACRDKRELRDHFVACVGRNGNPDGAIWDECLRPSNTDTSGEDTPVGTLQPGCVPQNIADYEERSRSNKEHLDAVNGIASPFKLQTSEETAYESGDRWVYPNSMCGQKFDFKMRLSTHSSAYDSTLEQAAAPSAPLTVYDCGPQGSQLDDPEPDYYELDSILYDPFDFNPQLASTPSDSFDDVHQQINSQSNNPPSNHVQSINPPTGDMTSHPSQPSIEVLSNQTLLSMFEVWQLIIRDWGKGFALTHPRFNELMGEMGERSLMDDGQRSRLPDCDLTSHPSHPSHAPTDDLTNQTLLSMFQVWQYVVECWGERYVGGHHRFRLLMKELVKRGVMSAERM